MTTMTGVGAWVGIGDESTYGTEAARTRYFPLRATGDALAYEFDVIESEDIDTADLDIEKVFQGQEKGAGSIEFEATYEGMLLLLKHAFGHDVAATGSSPSYVYAFVPPAIPGVAGKGLTIEVSKGDTQTTSLLFTGCKVSKITITGGQNQIMLINLEFLCQQGVKELTPSTPTPAQVAGDMSKMVNPSGQAEATLRVGGSVDKSLKSFTFSYDNKYEADYDATSKTMDEPFRAAKPEAMFECEMRLEDTAEFDAYKAFTDQSLLITFRDGLGTNQHVITAAQTKIASGASPFVNSMGVIYFSPTYKLYAKASTSSPVFTYEVTCDEATIT